MTELLNSNWLTSQPIDYEYKQYLLLAYKQNLYKKLENNLLYPAISDIISHKQYVDTFIKNISDIEESKVNTVGIDWIEMKLIYKSLVNDDRLDEIKKIASLGKTILDDLFIKFSKLYDTIESLIDIEGQMISMFTFFNGYIVLTHNMKVSYYEYTIKKEYYPEPYYTLELNEINERFFYKNRYIKNYFNVNIITDYPFDYTIKPVFKRKFLSFVVKAQ